MSDPASHDPQSLFAPVDAPGGVTTFYTSPTGTGKRGTRISRLWACNHTAAAVAYTLHHVPSGGAVAAANMIYSALVIPAGETFPLVEGIVLDLGDFFSHFASVAGSVSIHGYGWEMTD